MMAAISRSGAAARGLRPAHDCSFLAGFFVKTDLIDRIYECSFVPDLWPGVLDDLAELADSRGGLLFSARDRVLKWTASANLNDIFRSYVEDGWFSRCPRRVCLFGQSMPGFFVEHDFWTPDQLESKPIYRDFFRPHGLGWSAGTGLQMPTGDHIVFSIERDHSRGPIEKERVEALNELRSHLARSAFVSARLGLQRAKGANDALTSMGLPALLLGQDGTVVEANRLIEELGDHVQWRARNRIALTDGRANELLSAALAALDTDPEFAVRSFPLRDADDKAVDGRASDSGPAFRPRHLHRQLRAAGADAGGGRRRPRRSN